MENDYIPYAIAKMYIDADHLLHLEWRNEKGEQMAKSGFVIDESSARMLLKVLGKMIGIYDIYREQGITK